MRSNTVGASHAQREEYQARINRVIDYIQAHLSDDLSLALLADLACFSRFHFHRIFGAIMGESLSHFIQRLRLEKAAQLLLAQPHASVTAIALDCGFTSSASFARAFRESFDVSASEWRAGASARHPRHGRGHGRATAPAGVIGRDYGIVSQGEDEATAHVPSWRIRFMDREPVRLEVRELPAVHVAYVRHIGGYQGMPEVFAGLYGRLTRWAAPRGLLGDPQARFLAVYHDNPEITNDDKLRVSACLTVPAGTKVAGAVGAMVISGGTYAVAHFELGDRDFARAWHAVVAGWLPASGYAPDDRECFERFDVGAGCNSSGAIRTEICLPVRPL